jgi:DNA-binding GntR family transcriptional regulator
MPRIRPRFRRRLTVTQLVERLRLLILNGDLPPGTRLRQQHLAVQFGVSINAVREALMELKGSGLVESAHYRGVYVSHYDARKLVETLEIREVLEGLIARLCCGKMPSKTITELRHVADELLAVMAHQNSSESLVRGIELDRQFHVRLAEVAGNERLKALALSHRAMAPFTSQFDRAEDHLRTHAEHQAVLDAIAADQPDEAEKVMRAHIRILRERIEHRAAQLPGLFDQVGNSDA